MTFTKCEKDTNCKNNCLLVVDAMFFFYLIQALINNIEINHELKSRAEKFIIFENRLSNILNTFAFCSLNKKLNISEKVYEYEISPTLKINNRLSTLRREINLFNTMCGRSNNNFKRIESIIKNYCEITSINTNEVNEFRDFFGSTNKPKDRDATLLLLGLKKAHNYCDTLLLTEDIDLSNAFNYLNDKHSITLTIGTFNTNRYHNRGYLSFITIVYDCCQLDELDYITCFNIKLAAEMERKSTLNNKVKKSIIQKQLEVASHQYSKSIALKQKTIMKSMCLE